MALKRNDVNSNKGAGEFALSNFVGTSTSTGQVSVSILVEMSRFDDVKIAQDTYDLLTFIALI